MLDMLDVVVMVSGDGDYCALAEYVKNHGRIFHVASFRESTSTMLVEAADIYTNLSADQKTFLIRDAHHRAPERRTGSSTDTFDDVIAEQVANKAILIPKADIAKPLGTPAADTRLPAPVIPVFTHSFKKRPAEPEGGKRRGRPRKDTNQAQG